MMSRQVIKGPDQSQLFFTASNTKSWVCPIETGCQVTSVTSVIAHNAQVKSSVSYLQRWRVQVGRVRQHLQLSRWSLGITVWTSESPAASLALHQLYLYPVCVSSSNLHWMHLFMYVQSRVSADWTTGWAAAERRWRQTEEKKGLRPQAVCLNSCGWCTRLNMKTSTLCPKKSLCVCVRRPAL